MAGFDQLCYILVEDWSEQTTGLTSSTTRLAGSDRRRADRAVVGRPVRGVCGGHRAAGVDRVVGSRRHDRGGRRLGRRRGDRGAAVDARGRAAWSTPGAAGGPSWSTTCVTPGSRLGELRRRRPRRSGSGLHTPIHCGWARSGWAAPASCTPRVSRPSRPIERDGFATLAELVTGAVLSMQSATPCRRLAGAPVAAGVGAAGGGPSGRRDGGVGAAGLLGPGCLHAACRPGRSPTTWAWVSWPDGWFDARFGSSL